MFIKVSHNGNNRKFKLGNKATLAELMKELERCFGEEVKTLSVGYIDSENELITISNEEDWQICLEENEIKNKDKTVKTVTIQVLQAGQDFVAVGNDTVIQETAPVEKEATPEIQEEPKKEAVVETPENGKIIEEVIKQPAQEVICEGSPQMAEEVPKTEVPETMNSENNEHVKMLVEQINNTVGNLLGFTVDFAEAKLEPTKPAEKSIFEENNASVSSTMTNEMKEEIDTMIDEKVNTKVNEILAQKFGKTAPETKPKTTNFTHRGITCDGCHKGIHNCARYKSLIKEDYDLCEACERKGVHPGPMVRFSAPSTIPNWNMNKIFREIRHHFAEPTEQARPSPPRCPFGARNSNPGLCHIRRSAQEQQKPTANPAPQNPFQAFQGLNNFGPFNLGNIAQALPGLVESFMKGGKCPAMNQTKTEEPKPAQTQQTLPEIVKGVQEVLPSIDAETIEQIVKAHNLKNSEQVLKHLLE